jgi:hypothetical protein
MKKEPAIRETELKIVNLVLDDIIQQKTQNVGFDVVSKIIKDEILQDIAE